MPAWSTDLRHAVADLKWDSDRVVDDEDHDEHIPRRLVGMLGVDDGECGI